MFEADFGFGHDHKVTNVQRAQHPLLSFVTRLGQSIPVKFAAQG